MQKDIAKNLGFYEKREKPEKLTKYKIITQGAAHLTKAKKEREYSYYNCDYCGEEIKILKNEKTVDGNIIASGGIVQIPTSLTKSKNTFYLALCNKCLKPVLKQFEQNQMILNK